MFEQFKAATIAARAIKAKVLKHPLAYELMAGLGKRYLRAPR